MTASEGTRREPARREKISFRMEVAAFLAGLEAEAKESEATPPTAPPTSDAGALADREAVPSVESSAA